MGIASLSEECIMHVMQLLARLAVDDSLLSSASHQHLIQRCLAALVDALDPSSVHKVVSRLKNSST